jgi:hypothetical protein
VTADEDLRYDISDRIAEISVARPPVDLSRSIDHPKFVLQRDGYAAAVSDSQVLEAIKSRPAREDCDLLCRMVWLRRAEARD